MTPRSNQSTGVSHALDLFTSPVSFRSAGLCWRWQDCTPQPLVTAGEWTGDEECRNRTITCQRCGRRGVESENLTAKAQGKRRNQ